MTAVEVDMFFALVRSGTALTGHSVPIEDRYTIVVLPVSARCFSPAILSLQFIVRNGRSSLEFDSSRCAVKGTCSGEVRGSVVSQTRRGLVQENGRHRDHGPASPREGHFNKSKAPRLVAVCLSVWRWALASDLVIILAALPFSQASLTTSCAVGRK